MLNWCNKKKQSISHGAVNVVPGCRFGSRRHFNFHLPAVPRKLSLTVLTPKWSGFHQSPLSRSPKLSLTVLADVVWISSVPAKPLSEIALNSFNSGVVTDRNRTVVPASSFNGDLSKWDVTRWADGCWAGSCSAAPHSFLKQGAVEPSAGMPCFSAG